MRESNALIMAVTMPTEYEWQLYCQEKGDLRKPICQLEEFTDVWTENGPPGLARNHVPIMVDLKPRAIPVRQRQYPVPREPCLGIQTHLQWLKDAGILIDYQSQRNTPLLPIKKAGEMITGLFRTCGRSTTLLSHYTQ
jgi:hypothetical protein